MSNFSKSGPPDVSTGIGHEATEYQGNDPLVGQRIGKYKIVERIAKGGTATVYKAMDEVLKREVAFKILHQHLESRSDVVERFRVEAQTVASLRHPNILNVYDFFNHEGRSILVAEFMPGYTLSHLIKKFRRLPEDYVLMIGAEILQGLREAHARGFTHRDIKPANILMHSDLGVKISDFGLAKLINSDDGLTKEGVFVGTPSFSSPEQIEGKKIDHRTDLFSLGLSLYIMATGHHAFKQKGDSTTTVWFKIVRGEFQGVREIDRDLSADFDRVLERALKVDPDKRYSSADEMLQEVVRLLRKRGKTPYQDDLKKYLKEPFGRKEAVARLNSRGRQRLWAGLGVAGVLALGSFLFLQFEDQWRESLSEEEALLQEPVPDSSTSELLEDPEPEPKAGEVESPPRPVRDTAPARSRSTQMASGKKSGAFVSMPSASRIIFEEGDQSFNWRFTWKAASQNFELRDQIRSQVVAGGKFAEAVFDWADWSAGEYQWTAGSVTEEFELISSETYREQNRFTKRDLPVSSTFEEVDLQINPWQQQIRLTWESGPGADSYRVEIADDEEFKEIVFSGVVSQRFVQVDRLWDQEKSLYWRVQYLDASRNVFFIDPVRKINLRLRASANYFEVLEPRPYQKLSQPLFVRALAPTGTEIKCADSVEALKTALALKSRLGFQEAELSLTNARLICQSSAESREIFVLPLRP